VGVANPKMPKSVASKNGGNRRKDVETPWTEKKGGEEAAAESLGKVPKADRTKF